MLPERHVTLEVVCAPSVGGSLPAALISLPRSSARPLKPIAHRFTLRQTRRTVLYDVFHDVGAGERPTKFFRAGQAA